METVILNFGLTPFYLSFIDSLLFYFCFLLLITKNPTDSKETSTGTAGKKPTGTSVSGKQVKTAKTGDSISYLWILMIAGSIAVIGGMIYVIRRRKQK